jgi:putative ABC transport system ATP-binding protein
VKEHMPEGEQILRAVELYRFYHADDEETIALRGVSLSLRAGEMVAVLGPSASGKSTLLACMAGIDDPDGGTVYIGNHRVSRRPEAERAALRARYIGMLFQAGNLFEVLDVRQNAELTQRLSGAADAEHIDHLLDSLGIRHRARALPSALSGGELVRAGLLAALAAKPLVVLADEPTGEVDSETEQRILDLFEEQCDRGVAMVLVTHSRAVATRASRVVQLVEGRLAA